MLCAVYPSAWGLIASGFTDANLNATWTLLDQGNCVWQDKTVTVSLTLMPSTVTLVMKGQSGTILYTAPFATWNCCDNNSLTTTGGGGPATLTLTPLNCSCVASFCSTCPQCDSMGFPVAYQAVGVTGFVD